jgi:hypothetical protein
MVLQQSTKGAMVFYAVYGTAFFISLAIVGVVGIGTMPLFPLQTENLEWAQTWLVQTIFDYYGAAFCVCGVIIATERELSRGCMWVAAVCLLGCPNACLWATLQLYRNGHLCLASCRDGSADGLLDKELWPTARKLGVAFFPCYGVGFVVLFVVTMANQNLINFDFGNLSWCLWWLVTTCFDYYGCCFVLVTIMLYTEEELWKGIAWSMGALFVGTPASALWTFLQLLKRDTLALASDNNGYTGY